MLYEVKKKTENTQTLLLYGVWLYIYSFLSIVICFECCVVSSTPYVHRVKFILLFINIWNASAREGSYNFYKISAREQICAIYLCDENKNWKLYAWVIYFVVFPERNITYLVMGRFFFYLLWVKKRTVKLNSLKFILESFRYFLK